MPIYVSSLKIGDLVSEIENHTDLTKRMDCIHEVIFIEPVSHGMYMGIGLSGYTDKDRETETFSEFEVYLLPLSIIIKKGNKVI